MIELSGTIIIEDGKIILLYREDEGHWEVPGGKVEAEESPTEAAVRETKEEIGISVELRRPFYSGEFQHNEDLFLWHGYLAEITEGKPGLQEDKFTELKWIGSEELEKLDLAPNLRMIEPSLRKILE